MIGLITIKSFHMMAIKCETMKHKNSCYESIKALDCLSAKL